MEDRRVGPRNPLEFAAGLVIVMPFVLGIIAGIMWAFFAGWSL